MPGPPSVHPHPHGRVAAASFLRELDILRSCAGCDCIPELLEAGDNWYVIPFYSGGTLRQRIAWHGLLPIRDAKLAMDALRTIYECGWAHLDYRIENVLLDDDGALKVIDFEAAHRYAERPARFEDCWDIAGAPERIRTDLGWRPSSYDTRWYPHVGLDLPTLLSGSPLEQVRRRIVHATVRFVRRGARWLRRMRSS